MYSNCRTSTMQARSGNSISLPFRAFWHGCARRYYALFCTKAFLLVWADPLRKCHTCFTLWGINRELHAALTHFELGWTLVGIMIDSRAQIIIYTSGGRGGGNSLNHSHARFHITCSNQFKYSFTTSSVLPESHGKQPYWYAMTTT